MSRPIQPSGTSTPSDSRRSVSASNSLAEHEVDRQGQLAVGLLGPLQRLGGQLDALLLDQRVAGLDPLRAEEAEAHRAADQDLVGDLEEAVDDADLVGDLGAAEDDDQRPRRVLDHPGQLGHLALQQQPGVAGEVVGDALGAGVGAVGGAEGVVDVEVGERGEAFGQLRVVLRLPRLEAGVLEQQHVAGPERAAAQVDVARRPPPAPASPRPRAARRAARRPAPSRAPGRPSRRAGRGGRRGRARRRVRAAVRSSAAPPGSACRRRPRRPPAGR